MTQPPVAPTVVVHGTGIEMWCPCARLSRSLKPGRTVRGQLGVIGVLLSSCISASTKLVGQLAHPSRATLRTLPELIRSFGEHG
jgi:hypothetical protein